MILSDGAIGRDWRMLSGRRTFEALIAASCRGFCEALRMLRLARGAAMGRLDRGRAGRHGGRIADGCRCCAVFANTSRVAQYVGSIKSATGIGADFMVPEVREAKQTANSGRSGPGALCIPLVYAKHA